MNVWHFEASTDDCMYICGSICSERASGSIHSALTIVQILLFSLDYYYIFGVCVYLCERASSSLPFIRMFGLLTLCVSMLYLRLLFIW